MAQFTPKLTKTSNIQTSQSWENQFNQTIRFVWIFVTATAKSQDNLAGNIGQFW